MAAPMVVGLSALIRSQMPSLNKFQVDSIIMQTTDDHYGVNPGYIGQLGTGRINVFRALDTLANARFSSTETDGQVPHEVTFTDESPKNPTSWTWDFGDGNGSTDQNPVHTYTSPGVYDVSLVVTDDNGVGEEHLQRYVWARADTLNIAQVEGDPGTTVEVPISLTNTALVKDISITFTIPNSFNVKPNGLSVVGTRCEDFDNVSFIGFDNFNKRYSVFLNSSGSGESNYLQPGSGPIVKILFDVPAAVPPQTILDIDTTSWSIYYNGVTTVLGDYFPAAYAAGAIEITGCCLATTGNVNFDPADNVDISDLTKLVNHLFVTFETLECPEEANTNGDVGGNIDISDLTKLVNHLFVTFEALADCQ
jgi:PKD repeat protein